MIRLLVTGASFGLTEFMISEDDFEVSTSRVIHEPVENRQSFTLIRSFDGITCKVDGDMILIAVPTLGIVAFTRYSPPRVITIPNYEAVNHANSVIQHDDYIFISMHNHAINRDVKSWIGQYVLTTDLELAEVYRHEIGYDIHSLHEIDGYIVLCSSGDGRIMTMAGEVLFIDEKNRYLRGLASIGNDYLFVGWSEKVSQISERGQTSCGIFILDGQSYEIIREIELSKAGAIGSLYAER